MKEFSIRRKVALDAPPDRVWDAMATEQGRTAWMWPMPLSPDHPMVVQWHPGELLVVHMPVGAGGESETYEYRIDARGAGLSTLEFVNAGVASDRWTAADENIRAKGWEMYLHTLAQYLKYFSGRPARYIQVEGPQSSADSGNWGRLVDALRLPQAPDLEAWVHLNLDDRVAICGRLDYHTDSYVGLRTADALIRLHGRAAIGMTVAVVHYAYAPDIDRNQITQAWTVWLDQVFG